MMAIIHTYDGYHLHVPLLLSRGFSEEKESVSIYYVTYQVWKIQCSANIIQECANKLENLNNMTRKFFRCVNISIEPILVSGSANLSISKIDIAHMSINTFSVSGFVSIPITNAFYAPNYFTFWPKNKNSVLHSCTFSTNSPHCTVSLFCSNLHTKGQCFTHILITTSSLHKNFLSTNIRVHCH